MALVEPGETLTAPWTPKMLQREIKLHGIQKYTPNDWKRCSAKVRACRAARSESAKKAQEKRRRSQEEEEEAPKLAWDYNDDIALAHCVVHPSTALAMAHYNEGLEAEDLGNPDSKKCPFEEAIPRLWNSTDREDILTKVKCEDPDLQDMDPEQRHRGHLGSTMKDRWGELLRP